MKIIILVSRRAVPFSTSFLPFPFVIPDFDAVYRAPPPLYSAANLPGIFKNLYGLHDWSLKADMKRVSLEKWFPKIYCSVFLSLLFSWQCTLFWWTDPGAS